MLHYIAVCPNPRCDSPIHVQADLVDFTKMTIGSTTICKLCKSDLLGEDVFIVGRAKVDANKGLEPLLSISDHGWLHDLKISVCDTSPKKESPLLLPPTSESEGLKDTSSGESTSREASQVYGLWRDRLKQREGKLYNPETKRYDDLS